MWYLHSQSLKLLVGAAGLILTVAGCGATNPETPPSSGHAVQASRLALQKHLHDRWWYPPAITKHYPTTGVTYHIPSAVGLAYWHGNPTHALLTTLNHLFSATTIPQVMTNSDPSFWPNIRQQWQFPKRPAPPYREMTKPLSAQNIEIVSAAHSPYARVIQHWDGDQVLTHSVAVGVGQPGKNFVSWYKRHPALTPWLYFVDVRGHWLLYSIQN